MSGTTLGETKEQFRLAEYKITGETFRAQVVLITQTVAGFVVVNATVLGLGVTFRQSWLFLIGAVISLVIARVALAGERATRPILLRGVQLEAERGDRDSSMMSLWAAWIYGVSGLHGLQDVAATENTEEKMAQLHSTVSPFRRNIFILFAYAAVIAQVLLTFVLLVFTGWSFI